MINKIQIGDRIIENPKIAMVWAGGGAKGAFQAGVFYVLQKEYGIDPEIHAGVSVGALNATLACQEDAASIIDLWRTISARDVTSYVFAPLAFLGVTLGLMRGLQNNVPLRKRINEVVDPVSIVKSGRKLEVGAVDLSSGDYVAVGPEDDHFKEFLLASTAIPGAWDPVSIKGRDYVDGGVRNVTPIKDALQHNPDVVIIVTTQPRVASIPSGKKFGHIITMLRRVIDLMMHEIFEADFTKFETINEILSVPGNTHPKYKYIPCIFIEPDAFLGSAHDFSRSSLDRWIELGIDKARRVLTDAKVSVD